MAISIRKQNKEAHEFLEKHPVGVLATVDPDGNPHAAVIYFVVDDSSNITFVTKSGTKKADNLKHNSHAMLVVYDAASQTTVQVTGKVTGGTNHTEVNGIFSRILDASAATSGSSVPPISKLKEGDYIAFKLKPKQVRMASFKDNKGGEYEDVFETSAR